MNKILVLLLVLFGGCATYEALEDVDLEVFGPSDVNAIEAATVEDANFIAEKGKDVGTIVTEVGVVIGKPVIIGIGGLLTVLSGLAGAYAEGRRKDKK